MSKISCEVIRDLFPSYIDGLTSDVTNQEVSAHVAECEECRNILEQMKTPEPEIDEFEVKEIDFLKKTKQHQRKGILLCIAIVSAVAIWILVFRTFFYGQNVNGDYLSYNLSVSGNCLSIAVNTTSDQGIQRIAFTQSEGIVDVYVSCVQKKSFFYGTTTEADFIAPESIRQIRLGDRVIWSEGELISPLTAKLYSLYNPYVGDMPSNGAIVEALNMTSYTGNFKNELSTKEEPYCWKIILENDFSPSRQESFEERLTNYAYIFLSQIGNLDEVIYEYTVEGETQILSITSKDASAFAGIDIKEVGTDINQLEVLLQKMNLSNVVLGGEAVESNREVPAEQSAHVGEVLEKDCFFHDPMLEYRQSNNDISEVSI